LRLARTDEESEQLWDIRKNLAYSLVTLFPNSEIISTDVCIPISKLPVLIEQYKRDQDAINESLGTRGQKLQSLIIGHVGDGNFHSMMYDLRMLD
jgi:D-lactate dehydrogenase (cytochrome)